MGRFIGLSKNKGSGASLEDPSNLNAGLILTSNGTGFVLAGGASLDRDPLPDYVNANESINTTLTVTGAFGDSVYTFAWRNGAQYGLAITSAGVLTGAASSMVALSILQFDVTDTKYNKVYEVDVQINVSTSNGYPIITTGDAALAAVTPPFDITFAASGSPTEWSITSRGNLNSASGATVTIANTGVMSFPSANLGTNTYTFTLGVRNESMPAGEYRTKSFSKPIEFAVVQGEQQYRAEYGQSGGQCSYSWTAPSGVSKVHVFAIGGGGGGCRYWAVCGGHGGGSVWANNIPVNPGQAYCVQVGHGGCWSGTQGGHSCWPGMTACGGCCGCYGGCFTISSVNGGAGTCCGAYGMVAYPSTAGGGGGGAGYGVGGSNGASATSGYVGCAGGGGSATAVHSSTHGTGGGGGTGSCGMCCYTGAGACGNSACGGHGTSGGGGSGGSGGCCGKAGEPYSNPYGNGWACGGAYGGGGGGGGTSTGGGWGGPGVVRIIWGDNRCWPCCNTHNL